MKAKLANGLTTDTNWQNLDSDIGGDLSGITYGTVTIGKIDSAIMLPGAPAPLKITSDHADFSVRQNGPDLDIASNSTGSKLETGIIRSICPPFRPAWKQHSTGAAMFSPPPPIVPGEAVQGSVKRLAIDFGSNGTLAVSGPFRIAENGLLSGDFTIDVENYAALQTTLSKSFPQAIT